ncbi:hypothetical protein NHX12_003302 [Muraenolepis orangiensis]|uniref:T-complex protein 11-like protein n=1 Tax=Muraenolepis orangiensis TaxID=630683 RepID=A0A9Q0DY60_9TELE|nr:hypothetical protein NHX12_003302 [Muraenolepis orangiensis]
MQKDSDKPEQEAKEEERTQEPSDEAGRSIPSPRRGNTLQASPSRCVNVEELMETAKGVSNMALAHEIVVNQQFRMEPVEPAKGSLEQRVKEIMHKAFWDLFEAQLNEDPPSYSNAIKMLGDIKEDLLSCCLAEDRLRSRIEEVIDLPLIQQEAENGALDINRLAQFIVETMGSLSAPCRDEDIMKLKETTELVPRLKAIVRILGLMKLDMANFALTAIKPHLMQQSAEYERHKFQEFLEKQPNALDYAEKWLRDTADDLRESGNGSSDGELQSPSPPPHTVHNHAYLRLLKWDHASETFPETVLLDQARFLELQQETERLVLLSSLLLIVYNTTGDAISGLPGLMDTLKATLNAMIADMQAPSFSLEETLATIGEKLCVELSGCLRDIGHTPYTPERQEILKGQIMATARPDNPVRMLMESRMQSYMLASLECTQPKTSPPLPSGLAQVGQELRELAVRFSRLVNFNKLVFSPFYQKLLQSALAPAGNPSGDV